MQKIEISIPSTVNFYFSGTRIYTGEISDELHRELSINCASFLTDIFGGATILHGTGLYKSLNGSLDIENVNVVYSWFDKVTAKQRKEIISECEKLAVMLGQESVLLAIGSKVYFIEPSHIDNGKALDAYTYGK